MSNWNDHLWTEEVADDITYDPPTTLSCVPSPDSSTTINTGTHLALTTGWLGQRLTIGPNDTEIQEFTGVLNDSENTPKLCLKHATPTPVS